MRYTLDWYLSGEPFYCPSGSARGRCQCRGQRRSAAYEPRYATDGGTSDGRFIAAMGAEVVELGVPNASIHKVNECVRLADIDALHAMYLQVLRNLLG